jgi:hypothetical protein
MPAETQQAPNDSESESHYSDSELSSDDGITIENGDHERTTTSNKYPTTYEIVTEKTDVPTEDDSDTDKSLEQMLLSLRKTMSRKILKAAGMARSMDDEVYKQSLEEALNRVDYFAKRKEYYKNESKKLEEETKPLKKEVDDLKARANTLEAGMKAAREKAMELFK